jgi:hypothetical protein
VAHTFARLSWRRLALCFPPFFSSSLYHSLYHPHCTRRDIYFPLPIIVFPPLLSLAPVPHCFASILPLWLFSFFAAVFTIDPHRIILSSFLRTTNPVNSGALFPLLHPPSFDAVSSTPLCSIYPLPPPLPTSYKHTRKDDYPLTHMHCHILASSPSLSISVFLPRFRLGLAFLLMCATDSCVLFQFAHLPPSYIDT